MSTEENYPSVITMAFSVRRQLCRTHNKPASSFTSTWPLHRHEPSPFSAAPPTSCQKASRRRASSIKAQFNKLRPSNRSSQQTKAAPKLTRLIETTEEDYTSLDSQTTLPALPMINPPITHVTRRRWTSLPSIVELPLA